MTGESGYMNTHYSAELDPMNTNAGLTTPPSMNPTRSEVKEMFARSYPSFGDGEGVGLCIADGTTRPCGEVLFMLGQGLAEQCRNNNCGPVSGVYRGQEVWAHYRAYADGYDGYVPSNARYLGRGVLGPVRPQRPQLRPFEARRDTDWGALNGATGREKDLRGTPEFAEFGADPQNNSQTTNLSFLLDLLEAHLALQRESCRNLFGSDVDPSSLLANLANGGSVTFRDLGANGPNAVTSPVYGSETIARPDGTSFQRNTGVVGATITINSNAAAPYQSGYGDRFGANDAINRAITLIHELGHAANLIYGGGFGPSADGSPAILNDANPDGTSRRLVSRINSTRVHQACFR